MNGSYTADAPARARTFGTFRINFGVLLCLPVFLLLTSCLSHQEQAERALESERRVEQARDALIDYVATHGYFPCPADSSSGGREGDGSDHQTGICPTWYGFLPARILDIATVDAAGYAVDAWGDGPEHRIRYAVTHMTVETVPNPFTRKGGMQSVGIASLGTEDLLWVCATSDGVFPGSNCGTAPVITSKTPAIVWSVGPNARKGGASADEAENPNPNGGSEDVVFVSRPRSVTRGAEFDDVLTWVPLTLLTNRMVAAGRLP